MEGFPSLEGLGVGFRRKKHRAQGTERRGRTNHLRLQIETSADMRSQFVTAKITFYFLPDTLSLQLNSYKCI
jgi:hypothetical protein